MKKLLSFVFGLCFVFSIQCNAQQLYKKDLAFWPWLELYKNLGKKSYATIQYQLRLDNNITQFNSSNYYFMFGHNPCKRWNVEGLYQINTNFRRNFHTIYGGVTYTVKYKKFSFYLRTAYQHNRYYFSGVPALDRPSNEWRNRLRVKYSINKVFELSGSLEPTVFLSKVRTYVEKVRFAGQFITNINKYQNIRIFYLLQPDITSNSPKLSNVLGITYQITLPDKLKQYDKLFKPKMKIKKGDEDQFPKSEHDTYQ